MADLGHLKNVKFVKPIDLMNLRVDTNTLSSITGNIEITPLAGTLISLDTNTTIDGGEVVNTGSIQNDNLKLDGNTLSATNTDGGIDLTPDGTGFVTIETAGADGLYIQGAVNIGTSYGIMHIKSADPKLYVQDTERASGNTQSYAIFCDSSGIDTVRAPEVGWRVGNNNRKLVIGYTTDDQAAAYTDFLIMNDGTGSVTIATDMTIDTNTTIDNGVIVNTGSIANDNLKLDANTLSSTDTNGNIILDPNGTGRTLIDTGGSEQGKLIINGPDSDDLGPHIAIFTDNSSTDPIFQLFAWNSDDVALSFGAYWDENSSAWVSSDVGSNFQMHKTSDTLSMNYDSGISTGTGITWNSGLIMTTSGEVTKPNQPYFRAYLGTTQNNVLGGSALYSIPFTTEVIDRGGDYNNTTSIFTAPIDGLYIFGFGIRMSDIDSSHTISDLRIETSNQVYQVFNESAFAVRQVGNYYDRSASLYVEMDAGDTAKITNFMNGNLVGDIIGANTVTFFMGGLIC